MKSVHSAVGTWVQLKRYYPADDPRVIAAQRDAVASQIYARAQELMIAGIPLTEQQVEQIVEVLRGGAS